VALLDIRQRSGYLFLGVTLGHILLISAQVNSRTGVPVLEAATSGIFSEVQRAATTCVSGVRHVWNGYVGLRQVKAENDTLKRQLAEAQVAAQEQRALAGRASGLERLLGLRDRSSLRTTAAEIIGGAATPDFRTVTIDKGTGDGLRSDMAVISPGGVVGRIVAPGARSARVQLLIDRNAAAGALVERTRAQGVVMGDGEGRLRMEYVAEVFDVSVGDAVVTSGIDGIYPKGFMIGVIDAVERSGGAYKRISVKPLVDFSGLEEVLVVVSPAPVRDAPPGGGE
jgi:rod shape-determining protein MreC